MIITDTFNEIGSEHRVCEDYILPIENPQSIIISDGCSSSKNTDMGARILSYIGKVHLKYRRSYNPFDYYGYGMTVIVEALEVINRLELNQECLDATLVLAFKHPTKNCIQCYFFGDGYLVIQKKNDEVDVIKIEYDQSAPFYLSYYLNDERKDLYKNSEIKMRVYKNDEIVEEVNAGVRHFQEILLDEVKCVLVCSDGFGSFIKKVEPVHYSTYVNNFLNYPVKNQNFLKRTMNHYLRKMNEEKIKHYDDLSIGAFLVKE